MLGDEDSIDNATLLSEDEVEEEVVVTSPTFGAPAVFAVVVAAVMVFSVFSPSSVVCGVTVSSISSFRFVVELHFSAISSKSREISVAKEISRDFVCQKDRCGKIMFLEQI